MPITLIPSSALLSGPLSWGVCLKPFPTLPLCTSLCLLLGEACPAVAGSLVFSPSHPPWYPPQGCTCWLILNLDRSLHSPLTQATAGSWNTDGQAGLESYTASHRHQDQPPGSACTPPGTEETHPKTAGNAYWWSLQTPETSGPSWAITYIWMRGGQFHGICQPQEVDFFFFGSRFFNV